MLRSGKPNSERRRRPPVKHCTVGQCRKKIKDPNTAFEHPLLHVLLCESCEEYIVGDDDYGVGEDGHEEFCRWCGEGGDGLLLCENDGCKYVFCEECVEANLGQEGLKDVHDDDGTLSGVVLMSPSQL